VSQLSSKLHTLSLDIGGVVYFGKVDQAFFARWAGRANLDAVKLRELLWFGPDVEHANIGEISAEVYFERAAVRLGTDRDTVRDIIQDAYAGELNQDLVHYVRQIKKHVRVTALTNNWSFVHDHIKHHGIEDLFEVIISSAEMGVKKPNPHIYRIMLAQLKVTASEVVFIDDTLENIEVAQSLGIPCIHFKSTDQMISELDQLLF
jgi:putative hydrolase of the HAD superfamily